MRLGLPIFLFCAVVASGADQPSNPLLADKPSASVTDNGKVVMFLGKEYFLRSTKDGQYVFTPGGQEDLQRWTDMITLRYFPEITEGKSLAAKTIEWWDYCHTTRDHIFEINFVPRIDEMPSPDNALYVICTLRNKPYNDYDEFEFTALRIVEGVGAVSTYSHREYRAGLVSLEQNFAWMKKNKPVNEAWFGWDGVSAYAHALAERSGKKS